MALGETIHFLYVFVGNLFDIRMAVLALNLGMDAHAKGAFVDKQQPERTVFVNTAQSRIFMAHQAIANIGCDAFR